MVTTAMPIDSARRQAGFTLVEIMITVVVAGILTALAMPSLNGFLLNSRVQQAATDMFMTMNYARSEAINRNTQVSVTASGTWDAGWQVVAGGMVLKQTTLVSGATVTGPVGNSLTFNPNGRLSNQTAVNFTFSLPGNTQVTTRCVASALIGQPVLQSDANHDGSCING